MTGPFAYLIGRSTANRLSRQFRRLRQPRYAIALALGLAYLWFLILRQRPERPAPELFEQRWVELAGAVAVAAVVAWSWIFTVERRVLAFTPAEVTFLFPAPLSRRQLIHFKLLRSQLVILFNVLLWTLVLSYDRLGASAWPRAAGVWVLLTTLSLHRLGASFVRGSLAAHGVSGATRRLVSLGVLLVALFGVAWAVVDARALVAGGWAEGIRPFLAALGQALEGPLPRALLAPFRAMVQPLTASSGGDWIRAMVPALGLLGLHYIWVVRSDAAFEEAAAEASLRRARQLSDSSRGQRARRAVRREPPPYRLAPTGSPAGAILWKNLVAVTRTGRPRTVALVLAGIGLVATVLVLRGSEILAEILGWFAVMAGGFLLVVGPQWIRSDLRGDLSKLHLLRGYPITGTAVVVGEVAASTLVLSVLQLAVLTLAWLAFLGHEVMEPDLGARTLALAAAVLFLPPINLLGLLIHNGAAMLFPAWMAPPADRPAGVEALGQNMLAIIAYVVLLGLVLMPPVVAGTGVFVGLELVLGPWAAVPAAGAALATAAAEARILLRSIGRVFERTDPASAGIAM